MRHGISCKRTKRIWNSYHKVNWQICAMAWIVHIVKAHLEQMAETVIDATNHFLADYGLHLGKLATKKLGKGGSGLK